MSTATPSTLCVGWDEHMLFAAPATVRCDLAMPFASFVADVLPTLYARHPDFKRIDWSKVQWFRGPALFTPRHDRSLADQGFEARSVLRFRTPGLEGLKGSCG